MTAQWNGFCEFAAFSLVVFGFIFLGLLLSAAL